MPDQINDPGFSVTITRPVLYLIFLKHRLRLGGRTRTRTVDPLIKSQLLYQLSYAPSAGLIAKETPFVTRTFVVQKKPAPNKRRP